MHNHNTGNISSLYCFEFHMYMDVFYWCSVYISLCYHRQCVDIFHSGGIFMLNIQFDFSDIRQKTTYVSANHN